jgi:restriction endonuclease Mrr
MPIPDYQSLMLPLLELTASNPTNEFSLQEAVNTLADTPLRKGLNIELNNCPSGSK